MSIDPAQTLNSSEFGRDGRAAVAARWQHRQVTTRQLHAAGLNAADIEYRLRVGRLHRTYSEVYSLGGPAQTDRERWMAATLTYGPGTRLAASAAAELYGLLRYPIGAIHVRTLTARRSRDGIVAHHREREWPWRYVEHIPVTGLDETILDCAATISSDRAFRRVVRQAQAERLTSHARLLAFSAQSRGAPGVARLKRELRDGPSPTRSANEDEVLEVFRRGGAPLPNHHIGDDEVDLFFPALNIAVEVQSVLHDNPAMRAHDEAKRTRLAARGVRVLWVT